MARRSRARLRRVKRAAALAVAVVSIPLVPKAGLRSGNAPSDLRSLTHRALDAARDEIRDSFAALSNAPFAVLGLSDRAQFRYVTSPTGKREESRGLEVLVRWRLGSRWNEVALADPSKSDRESHPSRSRRGAR